MSLGYGNVAELMHVGVESELAVPSSMSGIAGSDSLDCPDAYRLAFLACNSNRQCGREIFHRGINVNSFSFFDDRETPRQLLFVEESTAQPYVISVCILVEVHRRSA